MGPHRSHWITAFLFLQENKSFSPKGTRARHYPCEFTTCHTSVVYTLSSSSITVPQPLPRPFSLSLTPSCYILFPKIKAIQNISIKSELLRTVIICAPVSPELNYLLILTASNTKNLCVCMYAYIYIHI